MKVADFDYELPAELIAQRPTPERTSSRLLHLDARGEIRDLRFSDLPSLLAPQDVVVLNDTRVIKARLFGRKPSGGRVQIMVERILGEHEALALMRAGHSPKAGTRVALDEGVEAEVLGREDDLYRVRFSQPVGAVLERLGSVPLPPYITHAPGEEDLARYQTVYASTPGAVAAPTAGLHFDENLLDHIRKKSIPIARLTLHVGAGTFQPVREETIEHHRMHHERYSISPATLKAIEGKRVLAVGTTSLRALEAAAASGKTEGETDLFIYPGYRFRAVDRLLTNFHLPKSTLLMLVAAFAGHENIKKAYAHAIAQRYRFFSYGDAMLIERAP
ncbi:MAG TPA: tRNA preQ1(34) S-adenosylmethionine ribosyltransferase-isomerase QueA [Burkholderiales bacterium]|jgi:S-adenosylmethionine:tRNA ribosyltransferase-isomerase|nr:tRNA preQ1(34) S-adenosylmethionine ribosyltransferase-isomerase QueA [Burkholderiales bacterium]